MEEAPFDDVHFRRALNFAVDKQLVANAVFSDLVRPATGVIPPGFVGFNPDLEDGFRRGEAKEELAKSKYADPENAAAYCNYVAGNRWFSQFDDRGGG